MLWSLVIVIGPPPEPLLGPIGLEVLVTLRQYFRQMPGILSGPGQLVLAQSL